MKKTKHVSVPLEDLLAAITARIDKREGHGSLGDCYVTIEIPDEPEPEPFRVRTARELRREVLRSSEGDFVRAGAQERTRDLAKLLREEGAKCRDAADPYAAGVVHRLADKFDAIADKDGE